MRNNRGFTIVEILVVVLIIGILAGLTVPKLFKNKDEARVSEVVMTINTLQKILANEKRKDFKDMIDANNDGNFLDDMIDRGVIDCDKATDNNGVLYVYCGNGLSDKSRWYVKQTTDENGNLVFYVLIESDAPQDKKILIKAQELMGDDSSIVINNN